MLSTIQAPLPPVSAPLSPPPPPAAAVLVFCVTLNFKVRIVVPHQWGVDETTASGVARLIRQIIRHFPKCRKEMICLPGNPNVQTQPGALKKIFATLKPDRFLRLKHTKPRNFKGQTVPLNIPNQLPNWQFGS